MPYFLKISWVDKTETCEILGQNPLLTLILVFNLGICQNFDVYLKPKVPLHCYYVYLFWVLVSGILNVFNSN